MKSKEELLESAKKEGYFNMSEVLYATSDGNIFLEKNKHDAFSHAKNIKCEVFVLKDDSRKAVKKEPEAPSAVAEVEDSGKEVLKVKKEKKNKA